ncbi:MAG: hypothetical protein AABY22_27050 [Nanoarchaeota archaeon]
MFRFPAIKFSPCEIDWLKANRDTRSINEISLYIGKSRNAIKNKLLELDGKAPKKGKKNKISRIGKRDDIVIDNKTQFFRSSWEANVARWLIWEKKNWKFEPKVFVFEEIKQGTVSYCPDFQLDNNWLEIKGMLDGNSQTAIRRFKKYYPEEFAKLQTIVGRPNTKADKFFKKMGVPVIAYISDLDKKYKSVIPNWE